MLAQQGSKELGQVARRRMRRYVQLEGRLKRDKRADHRTMGQVTGTPGKQQGLGCLVER